MNCTSGKWEDSLKANVQHSCTLHKGRHKQITPLGIQLENARKYQQSQSPNYNDARLFKLSRPKRQRNFHKFSTLTPRRAQGQSSHQLLLVVAGSLHPDEKPLSADQRKYHGLGVDVAPSAAWIQCSGSRPAAFHHQQSHGVSQSQCDACGSSISTSCFYPA